MTNLIEEYNSFNQLCAIYPNIEMIQEARNIGYDKVQELIMSGAVYNGYRYKYFNQPFGTDSYYTFPLKQCDGDRVVNQFTNQEEALAYTGMTDYALRQCLLYGVVDDFGYTWKYVVRILDRHEAKT